MEKKKERTGDINRIIITTQAREAKVQERAIKKKVENKESRDKHKCKTTLRDIADGVGNGDINVKIAGHDNDILKL